MKKLILILTAVSAALSLAAQTVPVSDIRKPELPSQVSDSLARFDLTFDYSIFNRPYTDLYEFNPHDVLKLDTVGPNRVPYFYAKIGAQYPLIPTAELYFQSKPRKGFCMGLYGNHNSFIGTRPDVISGVDVKNHRMNNSAGGALTYDWETGEFMLDAQYNYDKHSFDAGTNNRFSTNRNVLVSMNINSAHVEDKSVFYDITAQYRNSMLGQQLYESEIENVKESLVKVSGDVGATFDIHRINVGMNIELAKYSLLKGYTMGVVEFSPAYVIDKRWVKASLGVKFGTTYGLGEDLTGEKIGVENNIFPDVEARFTLVDKVLWIKAVATGGEDLNQMSSLAGQCPVVDILTDSEFGVRNLDSQLSVESVIMGRLSINLLGSYLIYTNRLYFAPMMEDASLCRVQAQYMDVSQFSYGLETFWKSQDLTLGGKIQLHSYNMRGGEAGEVTQFPKITANAFLRYSLRERLIASLDLAYRSKVSGYAFGQYEVPSILDANVNVNFLLSRHLAIYLKCGNLFNKRNQYMPMYLEPGRNFGGGVCVNF